MKIAWVFLIVTFFRITPVRGGDLLLYSSDTDGVASSRDVRGTDNPTPRAGATSSDGGTQLSVVYLFTLPEFEGPLTSAHLSFFLKETVGGPDFSIDLYG
ncbi:MAG: hypothetical protein PF795_14785, partial [Kiritimatiellae bacterium]|nr:hypothetical protein [Kiritimatiellia bacterium]